MICNPDLDKKLNAVQDWACWATGCTCVWIDQNDGGRVREANEVWGELRPTRIAPVGTDETLYAETGDSDNPAQGYVVGRRELSIELRMRSRSQEHLNTGWYALSKAQLKSGSPFANSHFFTPNDLSLAVLGDVVNMPKVEIWDDRIEDLAILELVMNTVMVDKDESELGTWIEQVEISSQIRNAGGDLLDSALQLNDEVMP